jgi:hypothetical protein
MAIKKFLMYIWFIICVQSIAIASLLGRMLTFGFIHYGLNELCRFVAMVTGLKLFAKKGKLYTAGPVFYFFNHRSMLSLLFGCFFYVLLILLIWVFRLD